MEGISSIIFDPEKSLTHYDRLLLFIFLTQARRCWKSEKDFLFYGFPKAQFKKSIEALKKYDLIQTKTERKINYCITVKYSDVDSRFRSNRRTLGVILQASKEVRTATKVALIYFLLHQKKYFSLSVADLSKAIGASQVSTKTAISNLLKLGYLHRVFNGRTVSNVTFKSGGVDIEVKDIFNLKQKSVYYFDYCNEPFLFKLAISGYELQKFNPCLSRLFSKLLLTGSSRECMQQLLYLVKKAFNETSKASNLDELQNVFDCSTLNYDNFWAVIDEIAFYAAGRKMSAGDSCELEFAELIDELNIFKKEKNEFQEEIDSMIPERKEKNLTVKNLKNQIYSLIELIGRFFISLHKDYLINLGNIQKNNSEESNNQSIPAQGNFILTGIEYSTTKVNPSGVLDNSVNSKDGIVYIGFCMVVKQFISPKQLQSNRQSSNLKIRRKVSNEFRGRPRLG